MDKYVYKNTDVLINKLDIRVNESLMSIEKHYTFFRIAQLAENIMPGNFNLTHLQSIHKHIFQDIYQWAGEIRTVDIGKGYTQFARSTYIIPEATKLFSSLKAENYLIGYEINKFSDRLAYYGSELNMLHPFREGNGRTIREYLRALAGNAGYEINYSFIDKDLLFNAFVKSTVDYSELKSILKSNIIESVIRKYENEWPYIRLADELFISKLSCYVKTHSENPDIKISELKSLYKNKGKEIESGLAEKDISFTLLDDLITDIRRYQNLAAKEAKQIRDKVNDLDREL
jgi:cell filamentation protein